MATVTNLQAQMLRAIARSEFTQLNGAEPKAPIDTETYADCVISDAQDKGVFTSLLNAGLAYHFGKGRDSVIGLTDAGFAAYKSL